MEPDRVEALPLRRGDASNRGDAPEEGDEEDDEANVDGGI